MGVGFQISVAQHGGLINRVAAFPLREVVRVTVNTVVHRVTLNRVASRLDDQLFDMIYRQTLRRGRTGIVVDQLVSNRAIDIVRTIGQRGLSRLDSQHDPVSFDVLNIVKHQTTDCHGSQVHQSGRFLQIRKFGVLRVECQRNEDLKTTSLILQLSQTQ